MPININPLFRGPTGTPGTAGKADPSIPINGPSANASNVLPALPLGSPHAPAANTRVSTGKMAPQKAGAPSLLRRFLNNSETIAAADGPSACYVPGNAVPDRNRVRARAPLNARNAPAASDGAVPAAVDQSAAEAAAAVRIQSAWRGSRARDQLKEQIETQTPYQNKFSYMAAVGGYAPAHRRAVEQLEKQGNTMLRSAWQAEWGTYQSTKPEYMQEGKPAFLYRNIKQKDKQRVMLEYGVEKSEGDGHIYDPQFYGNAQGHDMRTNSAWMMGLAHHQISVVLCSPVSDEGLVSSDARKGPLRERTTAHHFSALGKEVLALVQNDYFVFGKDAFGNDQLLPGPAAVNARLEDFMTPQNINRKELEAFLAQKGVRPKKTIKQSAINMVFGGKDKRSSKA